MFLKIGLTLVGAVVSLTPIWIFIGAWYLLAPAIFWEKLAIIGIGVILGGSVQIWLLILLVPWLFAVWDD